MRIIAIIPARGGSKGIPGKNIRPLAGQPLIAHSIAAALGAPAICRTIVSTDSEQIAAVARGHGAEVLARPAEISGDTASSESAFLHVLDHLRAAEGWEPDLVVILQPTSPRRPQGAVGRCIEQLLEEQADSIFSASPIEGFVWTAGGGSLQPQPMTYDPSNRQMRQELRKMVVEENGSIYAFKPSILRRHHSRLGGKIALFLMDKIDAFQVDEPRDLVLLEALMALEPDTLAGASGRSAS